MTNLISDAIKAKVESFSLWLSCRGAEILKPLNQVELIRFRTPRGISSIYVKKGNVSFYGEAEKAWQAFRESTSWRAMPATKRIQNKDIATIRKRDGDLCFFCRQFVNKEEESEEHLISLAHGGPNHISNKFLSHRSCNVKADVLSGPQKIKIHVQNSLHVVLENKNVK